MSSTQPEPAFKDLITSSVTPPEDKTAKLRPAPTTNLPPSGFNPYVAHPDHPKKFIGKVARRRGKKWSWCSFGKAVTAKMLESPNKIPIDQEGNAPTLGMARYRTELAFKRMKDR